MRRFMKLSGWTLVALVMAYFGAALLFGLAADHGNTDPLDILFEVAVGACGFALFVAACGLERRALRRYRA